MRERKVRVTTMKRTSRKDLSEENTSEYNKIREEYSDYELDKKANEQNKKATDKLNNIYRDEPPCEVEELKLGHLGNKEIKDKYDINLANQRLLSFVKIVQKRNINKIYLILVV